MLIMSMGESSPVTDTDWTEPLLVKSISIETWLNIVRWYAKYWDAQIEPWF